MLTNKTELLKYLSRLAQVKPSLTLEDLKRRRAGEEFLAMSLEGFKESLAKELKI